MSNSCEDGGVKFGRPTALTRHQRQEANRVEASGYWQAAHLFEIVDIKELVVHHSKIGLPMLGWSGRAPALPAGEAGRGSRRRGIRHVPKLNAGIAVLGIDVGKRVPGVGPITALCFKTTIDPSGDVGDEGGDRQALAVAQYALALISCVFLPSMLLTVGLKNMGASTAVADGS